jgi:methylated-DNA-[protein]-cysteine S-methyltransferase
LQVATYPFFNQTGLMDIPIKIEYFKTAFGELILGSYEHKICLCDWRYRKMRQLIDKRIKEVLKTDFVETESEVISITKAQLNQYFQGKRKEFDIPLLMCGTDFQKMVWYKLLQIPYGKMLSYGELAGKLDNKTAVRAVAAANGANSISIIIPCHRIIGSDGSMVGYAGGIQTKRKLLRLEGAIDSKQLSLFNK